MRTIEKIEDWAFRVFMSIVVVVAVVLMACVTIRVCRLLLADF